MLIKTIYVDLRSIQIIIKFKLNQYYNIKKKKNPGKATPLLLWMNKL